MLHCFDIDHGRKHNGSLEIFARYDVNQDESYVRREEDEIIPRGTGQ